METLEKKITIGIHHIKPTAVLNNFYSSLCVGLKNNKIPYVNYKPNKKYDVIISTTTNIDAQEICKKQINRGKYFIFIKSPFISPLGVIDFHLKGKSTQPKLPKKDIFIFSHIVAKDFKHVFKPNNSDIRFRSLFNIKSVSWHNTGKYILLFEQAMPEGQGHDFRNRKDWVKWFHKMCNHIKQYNPNVKIALRKHPGSLRWKKKRIKLDFVPGKDIIQLNSKNLADDMKDACGVITISSKGIIQAVVSGKPIYTMNKLCPTYSLSNGTIKDVCCNPKQFDYQQWLFDMSHCHWSLKEIQSGLWWNHCRELISE